MRFGHEVTDASWDAEAGAAGGSRLSRGALTAERARSRAPACCSDPAIPRAARRSSASPALPSIPRAGTTTTTLRERRDRRHRHRRLGDPVRAGDRAGASAVCTSSSAPRRGSCRRADRDDLDARASALPGAAATRSALARGAIYAGREASVLAFMHPTLMRRSSRRMATRHLQRQVPDPVLRARLRPQYTFGCKRILPSERLVPGAAAARTSSSSPTRSPSCASARSSPVDGTEREVDTIIYGTGFRVTDSPRGRSRLSGDPQERRRECGHDERTTRTARDHRRRPRAAPPRGAGRRRRRRARSAVDVDPWLDQPR